MNNINELLKNLPEAPTLIALKEKKIYENIVGSKLIYKRTHKKKNLYFYQDGSVLVHDSNEGFYHFITDKGRENLFTRERATLENFISEKLDVSKYEKLGSGNFSDAYSLPIGNGMAVKVTNAAMFLAKELSYFFPINMMI